MQTPVIIAALAGALTLTAVGVQKQKNTKVIKMLQQNGPCPQLNHQDFLARLSEAVDTAKLKGAVLNKAAVMAQAALETGWGSSIPQGQNGECSNNLFGIKAGLTWLGPTVTTMTSEYYAGKWVRVPARWRAYPSWNECLVDYAKIIKMLYPQSLRYADGDPNGWVQGLVSGKTWRWATDPNYVAVVSGVGQSLVNYGGPQWT
ncbi:MAG: glucosaminidase domain-containing protein [Thermaceae bacterium]|nr:glucosaminidase domain-containing protein [Thermaceae bacterium]